jgi:5-methylthioadenosine/S-adenosylhomocysteine deaminase
MTDKTLLKNGIVLTLDKRVGNFHQADVLIEGTKIAKVGPGIAPNGAEVIDASNMIVMPGFIDTHRHIWEGLLRNVGADTPLEGREGYIRFVLGKFAPSFRPQDAYIGNLVSALGAFITTLLDWSHIQGSPEHTDAVIKALQDSGMRAVFAYGFPWWGDWNDRQPSSWISRSRVTIGNLPAKWMRESLRTSAWVRMEWKAKCRRWARRVCCATTRRTFTARLSTIPKFK